MLGKYQAIFRSRWRALIWSAGVLMIAYCTVPSPEQEPESAAAARHVNPWALDKSGRKSSAEAGFTLPSCGA